MYVCFTLQVTEHVVGLVCVCVCVCVCAVRVCGTVHSESRRLGGNIPEGLEVVPLPSSGSDVELPVGETTSCSRAAQHIMASGDARREIAARSQRTTKPSKPRHVISTSI